GGAEAGRGRGRAAAAEPAAGGAGGLGRPAGATAEPGGRGPGRPPARHQCRATAGKNGVGRGWGAVRRGGGGAGRRGRGGGGAAGGAGASGSVLLAWIASTTSCRWTGTVLGATIPRRTLSPRISTTVTVMSLLMTIDSFFFLDSTSIAAYPSAWE